MNLKSRKITMLQKFHVIRYRLSFHSTVETYLHVTDFIVLLMFKPMQNHHHNYHTKTETLTSLWCSFTVSYLIFDHWLLIRYFQSVSEHSTTFPHWFCHRRKWQNVVMTNQKTVTVTLCMSPWKPDWFKLDEDAIRFFKWIDCKTSLNKQKRSLFPCNFHTIYNSIDFLFD